MASLQQVTKFKLILGGSWSKPSLFAESLVK